VTIPENLRAFWRVRDLALVVGVGFALYCASAIVIVSHLRLMPVTMQRMVEIKNFLQHQKPNNPHPAVHLLGSSVLLEGVDCDIIDGELGDAGRAYNLAWTGATFRQWLLVLPAVVRSEPRAVVLCVDLPSLSSTARIPEQRLNVAAWWDFLGPGDLDRVGVLLDSEELRALRSSRFSQLMRFRALPLGAFDSYLREVARPDLRYEGYETNFKAPWVRRQAVSAEALERNIEQYRASIAAQTDEQRSAGARMLRAVIQQAGAGGAAVIVTLTPLHPELCRRIGQESVAQAAERIAAACRETGAVFLDDSAFLDAREFSDAVHPFTNGRERWSAALGRRIAQVVRAAGG
jgi:hypothetical protein